jgi:hypothetical protein
MLGPNNKASACQDLRPPSLRVFPETRSVDSHPQNFLKAVGDLYYIECSHRISPPIGAESLAQLRIVAQLSSGRRESCLVLWAYNNPRIFTCHVSSRQVAARGGQENWTACTEVGLHFRGNRKRSGISLEQTY